MPLLYRAVVQALLDQLPAIVAQVPRGTDAAELSEQVAQTRADLETLSAAVRWGLARHSSRGPA